MPKTVALPCPKPRLPSPKPLAIPFRSRRQTRVRTGLGAAIAVSALIAAPLLGSGGAAYAATSPLGQVSTGSWGFVDTTKFVNDWVAQPGHGYGIEQATTDADLAVQSGGNLTLIAKRATDGSWRGPRYKTRKMYEFGTFSARIKLPSGQGAWPAFWLVDAYQPTHAVTTAEIDIMEAINKCDVLYSSVRNWTPNTTLWKNTTMVPVVSPGSWHIYTLDWRADHITFYLDGVVVKKLTPTNVPSWPFSTPMYLILDVSVGGAWAKNPDTTTPSNLPMVVDWVRTYS